MSGSNFSSSVAYGGEDSQSQTPLGTSSVFACNSRTTVNSNASSSNHIPLGTLALFGQTAHTSSATPQVAATPDASQATEIPIDRESEDIMDHDAAHSDHSDDEAESEFGDDTVLTAPKIDAILACILLLSSDSAIAATNAHATIGRLSSEILALRLSNQSLGDQLSAVKTALVSLRTGSTFELRQGPNPPPAQTYAGVACAVPANPSANTGGNPPKSRKPKAKIPFIAKSPFSCAERQLVL